MHAEHFEVSIELLAKLLDYKGNITAVGTTSVRTLESLYWLGVKVIENKSNTHHLYQWDAYTLPQHYTVNESIETLLLYMKEAKSKTWQATTEIMIVPGYNFRVINRLITNFHQPKSTLLLLISAFIGEDWKCVYDYAKINQFRFLSYGDSSLLIP